MDKKTTSEKIENEVKSIEEAADTRNPLDEALKDSLQREKFLGDIIRDTSLAIGVAYPDGRIGMCNPAFEQLTGYSEEELKAIDWSTVLTPPEWRDLEAAKLEELHRTKSPVNYEKEYIRKDGSRVSVELLVNPRLDDDENVQSYFAFVTDITERKKARETLSASEKKYRSLFETMLNGFAYCKMIYDKNRRPVDWIYLDINDSFRKITGITTSIIGKKVTEAIPGIKEDTPELFEIYGRVASTGQTERFEIYLDTLKVWFSVIAYSNLKDHFVAIFEDITERKKMEEEFLRAQKLESIGIFAGGIAHDFNNILTTIIGNVSMAKDQVSPEDEIFDLLGEAITASTRAQALTKQLLTFAKGGVPIKKTTLVKKLLEESSSFVLRGSKSKCEFAIADDLWPVEVDVGQMSQVIHNVVINADQAMQVGGIIRIAAKNLLIESSNGLPVKPGRYIMISVTDQGIGIAEEHLSSIFDPYFTTKQAGSGLGLATSYSIIKKHDGHIAVNSQPGEGTTFHIYLPASDKAIPEKEESEVIKGQGRILVMDDEASLRKMLGRMLESLGYESGFARDGAEAVRMYKEANESAAPYDAVILDLTVPGEMGGKEAIQKLMEIDPEVKAIVSSGYSEDGALSNFQEYGFKGMMPKPFMRRLLGKVLHDVLRGEKE